MSNFIKRLFMTKQQKQMEKLSSLCFGMSDMFASGNIDGVPSALDEIEAFTKEMGLELDANTGADKCRN